MLQYPQILHTETVKAVKNYNVTKIMILQCVFLFLIVTHRLFFSSLSDLNGCLPSREMRHAVIASLRRRRRVQSGLATV